MLLELIAVLRCKLECGQCADVIVQIDDPALLAANEGEEDPVKLKTFLRGSIKEWVLVKNVKTCEEYYQYTIEYDDDQLAEGVTGIDECRILKVCCADCLIDYVDEQFIDEATIASLIDNGDNTFTFDNGLGDTTTIDFAHTLSEPVPNTVRLTRPDGSFDEVVISGLASLTELPITGDGTLGNEIGLLISTDVGNVATLGTDSGVFVPPSAGETITTLVDNGDNTFTYTSEDLTVTVVDFAHTLQAGGTGVITLLRPDATFDNVDVTVNTTLPLFNTGAPGDPLDILLSTDVGNNIALGTDSGLFVPTGAATVSTSLPIMGDGSGGSPVDLLFSVDVGNVATTGTDGGLFVPTPVTVTALPITGDGSGGSPVDLLFSVDVGNVATTGTDGGLFVPTPVIVTALPITGDGSAGSPVDLLFSTDVGNEATTGTDGGIFVPPPTVFSMLPLTGDGSSGTPLDLVFSTDVGNVATTGTDGGVFVPTPTVVTSLPVTGDGSAGTPVDLLFSTDVGNIATTGTDGGVFVPAAGAFPSPGSILITRNAAESDNNGSGNLFGVRIASMGAGGTTASVYIFQVPANWDTALSPTVRARLSNQNAADGNIRFEWRARYFAIGDTLVGVDDQTITFTHVVVGGTDVLYQPTPQTLTPGLIAVGDYVSLAFVRLGGDAADTQSGNANLHQISMEFPRVAGSFGVTT
jgi:hypothetical protein